MKAKYTARQDGEWFDVTESHKISCCDCGLTHIVEHRRRGKRIEMMAVRDMRATAQKRRRSDRPTSAFSRAAQIGEDNGKHD